MVNTECSSVFIGGSESSNILISTLSATVSVLFGSAAEYSNGIVIGAASTNTFNISNCVANVNMVENNKFGAILGYLYLGCTFTMYINGFVLNNTMKCVGIDSPGSIVFASVSGCNCYG